MFAVILTLCTYASCNTYYVDSGVTMAECQTNLVTHSDKMSDVWMLNDNKALAKYLKQFKIVENVKMIQEYDYTCEFLPDSEIP